MELKKDQYETQLIELDSDDVDAVAGAIAPALVLGLFVLGYTVGRDIANR